MDITRDTLEDFFQGLQTKFRAGISSLDSMAGRYSTVVNSKSSQELYRWMTQLPQLREWTGERHIKNISTEGFTVINKKYEQTIEVSRDDLEDDNIGIYAPMAEGLGQVAARHYDKLAADLINSNTALGYDGKALLATDHPVGSTTVSNMDSGGSTARWYLMDTKQAMRPLIKQNRTPLEMVALMDPSDPEVFRRDAFQFGTRLRYACAPGFWQTIYGSDQTLDSTNFNNAFEAMMGFVDVNGEPMGIQPDLLVVPRTLRAEALELIKAQTDASGASNINFGAVDLVVSPWLATTQF